MVVRIHKFDLFHRYYKEFNSEILPFMGNIMCIQKVER